MTFLVGEEPQELALKEAHDVITFIDGRRRATYLREDETYFNFRILSARHAFPLVLTVCVALTDFSFAIILLHAH